MSKDKTIDLDKRAKRTIELKIRVNQYEHEKILQRVTENTLGRWLRNLALKSTPVYPADPNVIRAIGRIGSNLNQITKRINTTKEIDKTVLNEIVAIRLLLNKLIESNLNKSKKGIDDDS